MPLFFTPNGLLDVSTDPSDLPGESSGQGTVVSGAMQRLKNLRIDQQGQAKTRDGSSKINSTALGQTSINHIREQNGTRYSFAGTVIYEDESSIDTGLTSAQWSSILYNSFNATTDNVFALNGTDRKRIEGSNVYEWGIAAPTVAPTVATGALTGLTGDYNAKYTYLRKSGTTLISESDPSPAGAAAVTLTDESLDVTWTASSDPQVTHVRVYRTLTDGAIYYVDQDVAIGTLTVDSNTADGSLGSAVATDHDRPPLGSYVAGPNYNGTCFIAKENLLYFCKAKQPEYWPVTYFVEVSAPQFPIQTIVFSNGQPYALTKNKIHYIQGTGPNTFFPLEMDSITGAQGPQGAIAVQGRGIYHVGPDGIYLYSGSDRNITQQYFRPIFRGETVNDIPGIGDLSTAWLIQFQNKVYFGYASKDDTYPAHVLMLNLGNDRFTYYTWGREMRTVTVDETNGRLLAGDTSGFVWEIENTAKVDDDGTAITWGIESKDYTLQTRSHFPRQMKYDVDPSADNCTATGALIMDGDTHQTHSISGTRKSNQTKIRLVETGNGHNLSMKITGTGTVAIYAVEAQ